jgi:hypothetical protein
MLLCIIDLKCTVYLRIKGIGHKKINVSTDDPHLLRQDQVEIEEGHDADVGDEELDIVGAEVDELEHGQRHEQEITAPEVEAATDALLTLLKERAGS